MISCKSWRDDQKRKLKKEYGDKCFYHIEYFGTELLRENYHKEFDLEHFDNDPANNKYENLRLACHRCNCLKREAFKRSLMQNGDSKTKQTESIVSVQKSIDYQEPVIRYAEFKKGMDAEPIIEAEIIKIFDALEKMEKEDFIGAIANKCGLSWERIIPRLKGWVNTWNGQLKATPEILDGETKILIRKSPRYDEWKRKVMDKK